MNKQLIDKALEKGFEDLILNIFKDDDGYLRRMTDYEKNINIVINTKMVKRRT